MTRKSKTARKTTSGRRAAAIIPTEHAEQAALMALAGYHERTYPELRLLHAIPNGTYKSAAARGRFQREGLRPGVPDLCLPVARHGFHGLYIEMKRRRGGKLSADQRRWLLELKAQGFHVRVCAGADEAWALLRWYLEGPVTIGVTRPERTVAS